MKPEAAALASGRRPGIPESGSGTTAADGGRPGRPRRSRAAGRDPPTASHWPVQDRRRPGRPGARSTPASTAPKPPTWFTPCCPRTCTRSSPSSGAGPPTATSAGSPAPQAHSCAPATDRQQARTRPPDQAAPVRSDQTHPLTERRTGGQNGLSVRPHRQACRSQRACITAVRALDRCYASAHREQSRRTDPATLSAVLGRRPARCRLW